jgi:hypothetical protein
MRSRLVRSVLLAALIAVAIGSGIWAAWQSPPAHRLIYTEALPDGRVFQCFSDGSAIGPAGSTVTGRPNALPGAGSSEMIVTHPAYSEEAIRQAVEAYWRSGRSLERDQADFDRLSGECGRRR